jgi:hypothetical protein
VVQGIRGYALTGPVLRVNPALMPPRPVVPILHAVSAVFPKCDRMTACCPLRTWLFEHLPDASRTMQAGLQRSGVTLMSLAVSYSVRCWHRCYGLVQRRALRRTPVPGQKVTETFDAAFAQAETAAECREDPLVVITSPRIRYAAGFMAAAAKSYPKAVKLTTPHLVRCSSILCVLDQCWCIGVCHYICHLLNCPSVTWHQATNSSASANGENAR